MKKTTLLTVILAALLLTSCMTTGTLVAIDGKNADLRNNYYPPFAVIEDNDLLVTVTGGRQEDDRTSFYFTASNRGFDTIQFNGGNFALYNGNRAENKWKLVGVWNAQSYLDGEKSSVAAAQALTLIAGILKTAYTASEAAYYEDNPIIYKDRWGTNWEYRPYDNWDVIGSSIATGVATYEVGMEGERWINFLKSNLLFDRVLDPGQSTMGWMFFDGTKCTGPDYLIRYQSPTNTSDVYFIINED